tara:strand:- start:1642 stop:1878 length:237 start_codon:yes stop_codon:yes gene_type:complete
MPTNQNPHNQFLIDFVEKLQQLNEIEVEIPQENIKAIIENPEQYALDLIEFNFVKNFHKYMDAYKLGSSFAKKNLGAE